MVMVYNTQNYLVMDFVHRLQFRIQESTTFRELDLFPSSGERKETPSLLVPSE
jgi:hypothetical protein